jgi:hypothetical protein
VTEPHTGEEQTVLRLRLATLRRNLEQVQSAGVSVAHRRKEVGALAEVFDDQEGIQLTGSLVVKDIGDCQETLAKLARGSALQGKLIDRLRDRLDDCAVNAMEVSEQAERSANLVAAMSRRWATLAADEKFDEHVRLVFVVKAKDLIEKIDGLATLTPSSAWDSFQKKIRAKSDALFSDYVEFLSGLALRDTGLGMPVPPVTAEQFGPDVYVMADDLVKQIYRIGESDLWHSLTIPARRYATACTIARMVRVGFPEWTVWAVPLAAFEFGRVVIDEMEIVESFASEYGGVIDGLETALADVFATYVMGPAYAFASVYVLLDPRSEGPALTGSERAYVVFRTLELMDEGGLLGDVIDVLRSRWEMAVGQAQGAPLPTGDATLHLDRLTTHLRDFLKTNAPTIGYLAPRWAKVVTWSPLAALVASKRPLVLGQEDVRDILNAAWLQRLDGGDGTPTDRESDAALADEALALWRIDLDARRSNDSDTRRRWF